MTLRILPPVTRSPLLPTALKILLPLTLMILLISTSSVAFDYDTMKTRTPKSQIKTITVDAYLHREGELKKDYREVMNYNEKGAPVLRQFYNEKGKLTTVDRFEYNKQGDITLYSSTEKPGNTVTKRIFSYIYDETGKIKEMSIKAPDLKLTMRWVYIHKPDGSYEIRKFRKSEFDKNVYNDGGEEYDSKGRLKSLSHGSGDFVIYEYDSKGNIHRVRHQTGDEHWYHVYEYEYGPSEEILSLKINGMKTVFTYNERLDVIDELHLLQEKPDRKIVYTYQYR